MNILIVGKAPDSMPFVSPRYRGICRSSPSYCETQPSDAEINQLFHWYMNEGGQSSVVHDVDKARRYIKLWQEAEPKQEYELIEVVDGTNLPSVGSIFLGYGSSLIQWGLVSYASGITVSKPIRHLLDLVNYTFAPHLNAQGLFQVFEVASYCLKSMVALQSLHPNLYEGGDLSRFRVVGVFLVASEPLPTAE